MALANFKETTVAHDNVRLTERESEMLWLIAQGHSSRDIAGSLFVSRRTVESHLAKVYSKLGVVNRIQAVLAATHLGLIRPKPNYGTVSDIKTSADRELVSNCPERLAAN